MHWPTSYSATNTPCLAPLLLPLRLRPPAILQYQSKQYDAAKLQLHAFRALWGDMDEEARRADPEVGEQAALLGQLLGM